MISARKQTSSVLSLGFLLFAAAAHGQPPSVQNPGFAPINADTGTVEEGREDGKAAAGERRMEGRATAGFVGGLAIGTLGVLVFQEPSVGAIGVVSGLTIIGAAWRLGDTRPPRAQSMSERGQAYRRAYSESYETTVRARRGKAALIGGAAGTVSGLALMFVLGSLISSAYE